MEVTWIFCNIENKTTQEIDGKCNSCQRTISDIFALAKEEKSKPEFFWQRHNERMKFITDRIKQTGKKPKETKSPLIDNLKKSIENKKRADEEKKK